MAVNPTDTGTPVAIGNSSPVYLFVQVLHNLSNIAQRLYLIEQAGNYSGYMRIYNGAGLSVVINDTSLHLHLYQQCSFQMSFW